MTSQSLAGVPGGGPPAALTDRPQAQRAQRTNGTTRAALLAAAERVFSEHSYLDANVAQVVAAAGVAHGTFYRYFKNKEDAFAAVLSEVVADMYGGANMDVPGRSTYERIKARNRLYLDIFQRHVGVLRNLYLADLIDPRVAELHKRFQTQFVERIRRGLERDLTLGPGEVLDLDVAAWALGLMVEYFVHAWIGIERIPNAGGLDPEIAIETLSTLFYRAMCLQSPGRIAD